MALTDNLISYWKLDGNSTDIVGYTAIAFDASSWNSATHTCSGSNRLLIVGVIDGGSDTITGVSYGGVAMTLLAKLAHSSRYHYYYYLLNPASGENAISVGGTGELTHMSASYTGVKQTGQPDANSTNTKDTGTDIVGTVTTLVDKCWTIAFAGIPMANYDGAAGTGTYLRQDSPGYNNNAILDSNGAITPAGNTTLTYTSSVSTPGLIIMASFAPVGNNGIDTAINYNTIINENYITGDDNQCGISSAGWRAQTFTPTISHTVTSIKFKAYRDGASNYTVTAGIYATSGGLPTGSPLATGTMASSGITTSSPGAWYEITIGAGANLVASTMYAIVIDNKDADTGNRLLWRQDTNSAYAGGSACLSSDSGANWESYGVNDDVMFEEWGSNSGKINQGAGLNGTTSNILLGTAIACPTNVTIIAWIKKAGHTGDQTIIGDQPSDGIQGWFFMTSGQKMHFNWGMSGNWGDYNSDNNVITDTNWHFVCVTQTGTGTPTLYVDGSSVAATLTTAGAADFKAAAQGTAIGKYGIYTGGANFFNGAIDELGIWSRALSSGEITSLYNSGSGLAYPFITNLDVSLSSSISVSENTNMNVTKEWQFINSTTAWGLKIID
jgi:hypothetical protein